MDDLFQEAIDLDRAGHPRKAADLLETVNLRYPDQAPLLWYLGAIYLYELNLPRKALPHFRQATQLAPRSERASLGLFHALWKIDREWEALEEMKRFQTISNFQCQDYIEILRELSEESSAPRRKRKKLKTGKA